MSKKRDEFLKLLETKLESAEADAETHAEGIYGCKDPAGGLVRAVLLVGSRLEVIALLMMKEQANK